MRPALPVVVTNDFLRALRARCVQHAPDECDSDEQPPWPFERSHYESSAVGFGFSIHGNRTNLVEPALPFARSEGENLYPILSRSNRETRMGQPANENVDWLGGLA